MTKSARIWASMLTLAVWSVGTAALVLWSPTFVLGLIVGGIGGVLVDELWWSDL